MCRSGCPAGRASVDHTKKPSRTIDASHREVGLRSVQLLHKEFCPRLLLGYDVQPHKVMRSLNFTASGEDLWNRWAQLCCSCGLCTLYACPEDLYPKEACDKAKVDLKAKGLKWDGNREITPHPIYQDGRHVPLSQLIGKLGVKNYDGFRLIMRKRNFHREESANSFAATYRRSILTVMFVGKRIEGGGSDRRDTRRKTGARVHASIGGIVA